MYFWLFLVCSFYPVSDRAGTCEDIFHSELMDGMQPFGIKQKDKLTCAYSKANDLISTTYLFMNVSRPLRLSSMNSSSKMPSSFLNGSCLCHALLGNSGTTIYYLWKIINWKLQRTLISIKSRIIEFYSVLWRFPCEL